MIIGSMIPVVQTSHMAIDAAEWQVLVVGAWTRAGRMCHNALNTSISEGTAGRRVLVSLAATTLHDCGWLHFLDANPKWPDLPNGCNSGVVTFMSDRDLINTGHVVASISLHMAGQEPSDIHLTDHSSRIQRLTNGQTIFGVVVISQTTSQK